MRYIPGQGLFAEEQHATGKVDVPVATETHERRMSGHTAMGLTSDH